MHVSLPHLLVTIELYATGIASTILFLNTLYRAVKREITRRE